MKVQHPAQLIAAAVRDVVNRQHDEAVAGLDDPLYNFSDDAKNELALAHARTKRNKLVALANANSINDVAAILIETYPGDLDADIDAVSPETFVMFLQALMNRGN